MHDIFLLDPAKGFQSYVPFSKFLYIHIKRKFVAQTTSILIIFYVLSHFLWQSDLLRHIQW